LYEEAGVTDTALPADGDHTVTLPAQVYDTSSLTGGAPDPTGTITYSLWTDNACTTASTDPTLTGASATVTVGQPSPTLTFTTAGTYWWRAHYTPSASSRNGPVASDCSSEPLVVEKPTPTIATTPSPSSLTVGGTPPASFTDSATVSGGYFPTPDGGVAPGKVEFKLYGPFTSAPGANDCTTSIKSEQRDATRASNTTATASSTSYIPEAVGIYQWTAKYLGNAQNNASTLSACGDTSEQVTVNPATPSIASKILLSDRAKVTAVSGAGTVTGSVVFTLYPSLNCSGTAVYTSTAVPLDANGVAETPVATAVNAGSYSWKVQFMPATGTNYTGVTTTCTPQADETAVIGYQTPSPIS
jgi:hypothetical protein